MFFILVIDFADINTGDILPVYAECQDIEKFWLFKVIATSKKFIEGCWLQKIKDQSYILGQPDKIFRKNVVRTVSTSNKIFLVITTSRDGVYEVSVEACNALRSFCP